ncbi:MAG: hypothetical protein N4A33_09880 [Bacteriovoracaceae bacterium]|jgi:hypothetical protein|nr:hypothetical protein [Bacteriovoracaceae bacterium]
MKYLLILLISFSPIQAKASAIYQALGAISNILAVVLTEEEPQTKKSTQETNEKAEKVSTNNK